jgi:rubredoxin
VTAVMKFRCEVCDFSFIKNGKCELCGLTFINSSSDDATKLILAQQNAAEIEARLRRSE